MKNNPFNNIPSADGLTELHESKAFDATDIREELTREVRQAREIVELAANILINEDGTARDFLGTENQKMMIDVALARMESIRDDIAKLAKTIPAEIQVRFDDEDRTLLDRVNTRWRNILRILAPILIIIGIACGIGVAGTAYLTNRAKAAEAAALELISHPRPAEDTPTLNAPTPTKNPTPSQTPAPVKRAKPARRAK